MSKLGNTSIRLSPQQAAGLARIEKSTHASKAAFVRGLIDSGIKCFDEHGHTEMPPQVVTRSEYEAFKVWQAARQSPAQMEAEIARRLAAITRPAPPTGGRTE